MKAFGALAVLAAALLFTPAARADVESGPKAGEKVPDKVKDAYEKVSDKVEGIIPGDRDGDEGMTPPAE